MPNDVDELSNNVDASSLPGSRDLVELYFHQLRGEIVNILDRDSAFKAHVSKLETDLSVYKRAYSDLDAEKQKLARLAQELERQRNDLDVQLKGHRIVVLIDGDGAIFSSQLIERGQIGGHEAASMLTDAVSQHLQTSLGSNHYQIFVYVFLNKRGLSETFARHGQPGARFKLEEFITGFNQAAERFMMVDVGTAKEAADAKIKALLESEIRMPQTEMIFFGGCHDNGYVTTLRSQITAGFKSKLTLLRSYAENAAGINDLELPALAVPDLFISEKLGYATAQDNQGAAETEYSHHSRQASADAQDVPSPDYGVPRGNPKPQEGTTYSTILLVSPRKTPIPEPGITGSGSSGNDVDEITAKPRKSPPLTTRRINPNIPLSKHRPPPCTLFYLSSCKHGADCRYAHDYLLRPEHYEEIKANARKAPCPALLRGEICTWGEVCCYGHKCPQIKKCVFLKQGRCRFTGTDMHTEKA